MPHPTRPLSLPADRRHRRYRLRRSRYRYRSWSPRHECCCRNMRSGGWTCRRPRCWPQYPQSGSHCLRPYSPRPWSREPRRSPRGPGSVRRARASTPPPSSQTRSSSARSSRPRSQSASVVTAPACRRVNTRRERPRWPRSTGHRTRYPRAPPRDCRRRRTRPQRSRFPSRQPRATRRTPRARQGMRPHGAQQTWTSRFPPPGEPTAKRSQFLSRRRKPQGIQSRKGDATA